MSLINQMLKDLEKRRQQEHDVAPQKVTVTATPDQRKRAVWPLLLVVVIVALGIGWWAQQQWRTSNGELNTRQAHVVTTKQTIKNAAKEPPSVRNNPVVVPTVKKEATVSASDAEVVNVEEPAPVEKKIDVYPPPVSSSVATAVKHKKVSAPQVITAPAVVAQRSFVTVSGKDTLHHALPAKATVVVSKQLTPQQRAQRLFARAKRAQSKGRYGDSVAVLRQALNINDENPAVWYALAVAYLHMHQVPMALSTLASGMQNHGDNIALATMRARLLLETGDKGKALKILQQIAAPAIGENENYYALLATLLQQNGAYGEAGLIYAALTTNFPQRGQWWIGRGICADNMHKSADARSYYRRAVTCPGLTSALKQFALQQLTELDKR